MKAPVTIDTMSLDELNKKLEHSYQQSIEGKGRPFAEVFDEIEESIK